MCLIAYQCNGDKPLPESTFRNGWKDNPHGAGYMFTDGAEVIIRKPFFKLKDLLKAYGTDFRQYGAASPFITHFRFATHGGKTEENTHPHLLDCGIGLVHNGILREFEPAAKSDQSDTVHFCNTVLAYRNAGDVMNDHMRGLLERMIGTFNKFVMLAPDGNVSVVNEKSGIWDGSVWYSNAGYLDGKPASQSWNYGELWDSFHGKAWDKSRDIPPTTDDDPWADEDMAWLCERYACERMLCDDGRWNDPAIPDSALSDSELAHREALEVVLQAQLSLDDEFDRRIA